MGAFTRALGRSGLWADDRRDPAAGLGDLEAAQAGESCPICTRGLCVRHSAQAMTMRGAPPAASVVASTLHARLAVLRWELEEQLRRGDWQARPEPRGTESSGWLRAPSRFAGTAGAAGIGG